MKDYIEDFRDAMRKSGLDYAGTIVADGRLRRFKASGDRRKTSWYVLHPANGSIPAVGIFGCWKRQFKDTWYSKKREQMTGEQYREFQEWLRQIDAVRERAEQERQAKAQKTAAWILGRAGPVTDHPYLTRKGVGVHGELRKRGDLLVLPLRDSAGVLCSLQFIAPDKRYDGDRDKQFLRGGKVAGCFYTIAEKQDGPLVLCEGFATGASVFEATSLATACAMNCGNLLAVAKAVREKFPAREIIIAADDDQWTDGNPGLAKATEAAKAISAKLAVPHFTDISTKPTDFNDLRQMEGLDAVKTQIENAITPTETDDEILQRLAALPLLEYQRSRKAEAKKLGITQLTILDELVESKRPKRTGGELQGSAVDFPDVEPWPEPVTGAEVLSEIAESFGGYTVLPRGGADASALWVAHTHCFESFTCTPRLNITSPLPRCGKTTHRDVLALFVPRPLLAENLTPAVLFRLVELHRPTVLADECDGWLKENEDLRCMLNSGHRRGGKVFRCAGDDHEVRAFNVFAPVALCGIGALPGTLHDRSIVIPLERAKPGELKQRFDSRSTEQERELARKLARFIADNKGRIAACDPKMPDRAYNRLADNWRPLFAIAEIAGGDWPQRAAAAFAALTAKNDMDAQGIGTKLLADIAEIFTRTGEEKLPSAEIVKALVEIEGREWAEWGKSRKPISTNQLARQLKPFNIAPRSINLSGGKSAKGYHREMFSEAFERYLSQAPFSNRHTVTTPENIGDFALSETSPAKDGLRIENDEIANKNGEGDGMTVQKEGMQEGEALPLLI